MIENGRPSSYLARTMLPSRKRLCHREDVIACDRDLGLFQQTMSQAGRRQEQRLLVGWPAVKQPAQHAKQISAHEAADSKEVGRTGKEIYKSGIDRDREVLVEPWRSRIFNGRMGIRRPKSKEIESGRGRPERPDRSARTGGHSGPRKPPHPTARSTGQADLERVHSMVACEDWVSYHGGTGGSSSGICQPHEHERFRAEDFFRRFEGWKVGRVPRRTCARS